MKAFGGLLSVDAVGSYARNAVSLSNFTGACSTVTKGPLASQTGCTSGIPEFYGPDDLKATLSNNTGIELLAKYKWGPVTLSGGWLWWQQANPSDDFLNGFESLGGYSVPATIVTTNKALAKLFPTAWTNYTAYNKIRVVNVPFVGAKYAINLPAGRGRRLLLRKPKITIIPRPRPAPTPRPVSSTQTGMFSTSSAKAAALAPARKTPFPS